MNANAALDHYWRIMYLKEVTNICLVTFVLIKAQRTIGCEPIALVTSREQEPRGGVLLSRDS